MGLQATWSSEMCSCDGRGMELDDLQGPFQPKPLYDLEMLWNLQYFSGGKSNKKLHLKPTKIK